MGAVVGDGAGAAYPSYGGLLVADTTDSTIQTLPQRIAQVRALLSRLDALEADLRADAERFGTQADNARDIGLAERYEALYQATQARLRELLSTREALSTLLERLESTLEALPDDV